MSDEQTAQRKKRHHAVPQRYLERFADSDGLLWVHDRKTLQSNHVHPRHLAVERFLYSPEAGDDPHDDSLEEWLATNVDGPTMPLLEKLVSGDELDANERRQVSLYVAFQEYRIPRVRDRTKAFMEDVLKKTMMMYAANPDAIRTAIADMTDPLTFEEARDAAVRIWKGESDLEATKRAWLEAFTVPIRVADIVNSLSWVVLAAPPGIEFLTSDSPVVKFLTDRSVPSMFAGGWLSPSAEARFPLDPQHTLAFHQGRYEGRRVAPRSYAKTDNSILVRQAHRFVFSRRREPFVNRIIARRSRV